jgi:beta-lactamase class A
VTTSSSRAGSRGVPHRSAWLALFGLGVVALFVSAFVLAAAVNDARARRAPGITAADIETRGAEPSAAQQTVEPTSIPEEGRAAEITPGAIAPLEPATTRNGDPELLAAVEQALGEAVDHFGVVVVRLSDGKSAELNPHQVYYAASLFKLPILYEAAREISAGTLDVDSRLQLTEEDLNEDLGTLGEVDIGEDGTVLVSEALRAMVTLSDNTSAVALFHRLGGAVIDATLRGVGIEMTSVNTEELPTTASDMARIMEVIVRGEGLSDAATEMARSLLLAQGTRTGIPAGIPRGVAVGNKTGNWEGVTHDVAFVEAPGGTYVITVLSDGSWDWDPVTRVSAAVYAVMTGN